MCHGKVLPSRIWLVSPVSGIGILFLVEFHSLSSSFPSAPSATLAFRVKRKAIYDSHDISVDCTTGPAQHSGSKFGGWVRGSVGLLAFGLSRVPALWSSTGLSRHGFSGWIATSIRNRRLNLSSN
ncbi:hypothetical protein LINPERPRIM_LOCUS33432 [Linum perenne]